jgi:dGTPase
VRDAPRPLVDGYDTADWSRLRGEDGADGRSPFARDLDRLIYTGEFRKLLGKAQVASAGEANFFRTRLTHTLEVAQVARRLAESINRGAQEERARAGTPARIEDAAVVAGLPAIEQQVDPDLVEAAAVLHDLGHPPFAHVGEAALAYAIEGAAASRGLTETGSFNGNAQSFRLVTRILSHHGERRGLQLTFATLDAALKYPWVAGTPGVPEPSRWSVNPTEASELETLRGGLPEDLRYSKTLEAQVMDWADDVAYSVHDVDDWNRAGYIPLARLASDAAEQERFAEFVLERRKPADRDGLRTAVLDVLTRRTGPLQPFRLAQSDGETIFDITSGAARRALRRLRGNVFDDAMSRFVVSRRAEAASGVPRRYQFAFAADDEIRFTVSVLKELLWLYVVDDWRVATQQHGHRHVVLRLFDVYSTAALERNFRMFPADRRRYMEGLEDPLELLRAVADYVCGMTDNDACRRDERLCTGGTALLDYV